jgi:hypothetical protein
MLSERNLLQTDGQMDGQRDRQNNKIVCQRHFLDSVFSFSLSFGGIVCLRFGNRKRKQQSGLAWHMAGLAWQPEVSA